MTILTRISRLVKSDLHGILDVLEDPQAVLKQAIREMEAALEAERAALDEARAIEQRHITSLQLLEISRGQLDEKIDLCFENGEDRLARGFVRRKLETERCIASREREIEAVRSEQSTTEKRISIQQEELKRIQEKAALMCQELSLDPCKSFGGIAAEDGGISEEDVEVAFIAEKKRRAQQQSSSQPRG